MQNYTLGFMFDEDRKYLLTEYTKNRFKKGQLNAIGNTLTVLMSPSDKLSFRTNFYEKTGIYTHPDQWCEFALIKYPYCVVKCYKCFSDDIHEHYIQPSLEMVRVKDIKKDRLSCVYDLKLLVELALFMPFATNYLQTVTLDYKNL